MYFVPFFPFVLMHVWQNGNQTNSKMIESDTFIITFSLMFADFWLYLFIYTLATLAFFAWTWQWTEKKSTPLLH